MSLYFGPVGSDPEDLKPLDSISGVSFSEDTDYIETVYRSMPSFVTNKTLTVTVDGLDSSSLLNLFGVDTEAPQQHSVLLKTNKTWDGPKMPKYPTIKGWKKLLTPYYRYKHHQVMRKWQVEYSKWIKDGKPDLECSYYVPSAYIDTSEHL